MRLASIAGYIQALVHAGQGEFAEKMWADLQDKLDWLSQHEQRVEYPVAEGVSLQVPSRKVILSDDGTLHGFGFQIYRPVDWQVYSEALTRHETAIEEERKQGKTTYDTAHKRAVQELRIRETMDSSAPHSSELSERRYANDRFYMIHYVPWYHGGLIYHGPGAGQTFTVSLDTRHFWGIHT